MSKKLLIGKSCVFPAAACMTFAVAAQAAPFSLTLQSEGVLGSPVAQVPMQDPAIEHAIEFIQQARQQELKFQSNPVKTIGKRRHVELNHAMILGGPEVVPM